MTPTLTMTFHLNTISHLGSQLYHSVPPAIAELLSNSYDADSTHVEIKIDREQNQISVTDNGHGMTFDELNSSYLVVGRNRRRLNEGFSKSGTRKVTGRKGLGKLAIFGIADSIEIITVCEGYKNAFTMNQNDILHSEESQDSNQLNTYSPVITLYNQETDEPSGTSIIIKSIRLASITSAADLAHSLSNRFNFFDETFTTKIIDSRIFDNELFITNELHLDRIEQELNLKFPDDFLSIPEDSPYKESFTRLTNKGVTGEIITSVSPLQKINQGFVIYSRNKLTQERGFFNERSNDHFNNYATGYFHVDFIDDGESDFISTGRTSIFWEKNIELQTLKSDLDKIISYTQKKWREQRTSNRASQLETNLGDGFWDDLDGFEKNVLQKIKNSISNDLISEQSPVFLTDLMKTIKTQVKFESFKEYLINIDESDLNIDEIIKISEDWEIIEIKELAKVASGRISTINKLKKLVLEDASETKFIQPFFEMFPWILDPKMTVFRRELTFKKMLKEEFPDEELEGSNRRIDFLCSSSNGSVHIIELKRPAVKIGKKQLDQAQEYRAFIKHHYPNITELKTFIISNRIEMDYKAEDLAGSLRADSNPIIIKTYEQLITECQQYHSEFIEVLEKLEENK